MGETNQGSNVAAMTQTAIFTALIAVCSWISIPIPGTSVPINLATFAVILAGAVLGRKYGTVAVAIFLLLGAVGAPVFHSFTGGFGIFAGPTGGYLIGYLPLAFMSGIYKDHADKKWVFPVVTVIGEVILYILGTLWFTKVTGTAFVPALAMCVFPFIPGDIAKMIVAYIVAGRLRKAVPAV